MQLVVYVNFPRGPTAERHTAGPETLEKQGRKSRGKDSLGKLWALFLTFARPNEKNHPKSALQSLGINKFLID